MNRFKALLLLALAWVPLANRVLGQAGCQCEPAGIRGTVNATNGPWHGHLPFQTSPGVLDFSRIDIKYLRETIRTFGAAQHNSSYVQTVTNTVTISGGFQYEFPGTIYYTNSWNYDASTWVEMSREGVDGTRQFTGSLSRYWATVDGRTIEVHTSSTQTYCCDDDRIYDDDSLSAVGNGTGSWAMTHRESSRHYRSQPTPAVWIESGTTNTGTRVVNSVDLPSNPVLQGKTATVETWVGQWLVAPYTDPVTNTVTRSVPYTKHQLRDEYLVSKLQPSGVQANEQAVEASFTIDGSRTTGAIQRIESLNAFLSGEAGQNYLIWYKKTTRLRSGESKEEEFGVVLTGMGPSVEVTAAIPYEALPSDEGSIRYEFLRVEPLNIASGDPEGGLPGNGGFSGVGSVGAACASCGGASGPGVWGPWGGGTIGFGVTLGAAPGGAAAGRIQVAEAANRPALLSRSSLKVSGYTGVLDIRQDGSGLRQVWAPTTVADAQSLTNGGYELKLYAWSSVATTNGAYATFVSGAVPQATWRVEPDVAGVLDGNRVRVTATTSAGASKTVVYAAETNAPAGTISWKVTAPGSLFDFITETWSQTNTSNVAIRVERQAWRWPGGTTNVFVQTRKFAGFAWGWGVVEATQGEGAAARTSTVEYWTGTSGRRASGEIARTDSWNGEWETYDYDSQGRLISSTRPFGTLDTETTEYSYTPISGSGDANLAAHSRIPRQITERVGTEVRARSWSILKASERQIIRAADPASSYSGSTNRVSWSWHYPSGNAFAGRFWKKLSEDGILTIYSYATNASGRVTTVLSGSPAGGNPLTATAIVHGTEITTVVGTYGETLSQTSRWIDGGAAGATFGSVTFSDFDEARRWRRMDLVDGTYETRSFDCCGLGLVTDRDGVTTQMLYDAAGRQIGSSRLGITVTNQLDPAGAAIRTVRVGTDGTTNLLSTAGFDSAGMLLASTNALGGVTTYSWTINGSGELEETAVDPAGATQTVRYYRDGEMRSVTGTGVPNRKWTRTFGLQFVDVADQVTIDGMKITETVLDASGLEGDSTVTVRDALGQVRRVDQGSSVRHAYAYNKKGQRVQEMDADLVTHLYRYNAEGEVEYVAMDVDPSNTTWDANGDPSIDMAQDRLMRQATDSTTYAGQTVRRMRRWEYPTSGSTSAVEVRASMVTPDARKAWSVDRGQASAHTLTMNRTAQTRNVTNTAPDGSWTVALYTSGRLTSLTSYSSGGTQITRETYGYDSHGRRNQATDARNGTRSYTFNAADMVVTDTTPASGTGQKPQTTTRQYSTAGRLTRVTLPDGAALDLQYSPDGLLTNRSGGRQPAVGYAYDAAGRLTTLTTWKNATAKTGAKTTQWSYAPYTGFMTAKAVGNEPVTFYTYTAAGRPRQEQGNSGWGPTTEWKYGFDFTPPVRRTADVVEVLYTGTTDFDGLPATPDSTFSYDRPGRRIGAAQVTSGSTNSAVTWTRNSYGQITAESWTAGPLAGHILTHGYDDRLRRTNLTIRLNSTTNGMVGYAFDAAGRISSISDGTSSATYSYVPDSPLIQQVQLRNGSTVTLALTRQYDRWNRLHTLTAAGTGSGVVGQEFTYNDAGQRIRTRQLDGSYWVYDYDALGQVKSAKRYWSDGQAVAGQQFEYAYDDIGNRTTGKSGGDSTGSNLRTTTATTDGDGLLVGRQNPRQYEVQGAALAGVEVKVNGVVATRQGEYFRHEGTAAGTAAAWVDHSLTLAGVTTITGKKRYVPPQTEDLAHDVFGNRVLDGRWEMRWDNENRLVDVATRESAATSGVPRERLRYVYDTDGRLIERRRFAWSGGDWTLAETTRYVNDGLQCVAEYNGSNALQRRQVWGLDVDGSRGGLGGIGGLLWIVSAANGTHYAAADANGNVVALFGTGGTETARYEYGPFGEVLRMSGSAIALENPWRFSSKRQDATTDWVHYEYRMYDPATGRWLSRDPIGEAGGENLYGFVGNDPVNRVDLFGLSCAGGCGFEAGLSEATCSKPCGLSDGIMAALPSHLVDRAREFAQGYVDRIESPTGAFFGQLGLELGGMILDANPLVAGSRMGVAAAEAYCEEGVLGVAKAAYAGLEEMVGTADFVRAADYEGKYTGAERAWYALQGTAKSFLTVVGAVRGGNPAAARPPPSGVAAPGAAGSIPIATAAARPQTPRTGLKPSKPWRDKIHGRGQATKTDGHRFRSLREAIKEAKKPDVCEVHLDHGYNRALGLKPKTIVSNRRPDVTSRYSDGRVKRIEVKSSSDSIADLINRNVALDAQLIREGFKPLPPVVVTPTRKLP